MFKTITRDQLQKMLSSGQNFKLVDVLDRAHYEREHIKGAISLPVDEIENRASELLNKVETIVVYCASFTCSASTNAAEKLSSLGYKNVLDYKGGTADYKAAGLPLEGSLKEAPVCTSC